MRKAAHCVKCGSVTTFSAPISLSASEGTKAPYIEVQEHPEALLFKGPHRGVLKAWICGNCGYTEIYTTNAQILYRVYDKARTRHEREEAERTQQPSALLLRPASSGEDTEPKELLRPADESPQEGE